jgi:hypothetical protein
MIELDPLLIYEARRLITGANVHRLKQMIFLYEQAVLLYNERWPRHEAYQPEYEFALREFVVSHWQRRAA